MNIQPLQFLIGALAGILVSFIAWKAKSLSVGGAAAAAVLGTVVFGLGGLSWSILLLGFFISSSVLSKFSSRRKAALNEKFSKGSQRDTGQVLANGGVAGIFVLLHLIFPASGWTWFGYAGAMAAVNADTWATELGVLGSQAPRMITNGKVVERGSSGAISLQGTVAAFSGALFIAVLALPFWPSFFPSLAPGSIFLYTILISVAGLFGSLVDSFLGATVQAIFHCPSCNKETERHPAHLCGTPTTQIRGWPWMDNDWVNTFCSLAGAIFALLFSI
jgi:uncharacterized protein (TIGR00297 family)